MLCLKFEEKENSSMWQPIHKTCREGEVTKASKEDGAPEPQYTGRG
jgi:hypothetical protein